MTWFDSFREDGWNTYYPENRSSAIYDPDEVLIVFFGAVLGLVVLVIFIGSKGPEPLEDVGRNTETQLQKWTTLLRLIVSLHAGVTILVCVLGQFWQEAAVVTRCEYSPLGRWMNSMDTITAKIGVRVGLSAVNVTLSGDINSTLGNGINYNEQFSFISGFHIEQEILHAKGRGLPQAILTVMDYFAVDSGGLRWKHSIREAGHFTTILLWTSFVTWLVSNVLLFFDIVRGAAVLALTGVLMMTSCVMYNSLQPSYPLIIPFMDGEIQLKYGFCLWLCATSGFLSFLTGVVIGLLYYFLPKATSSVFLMEPVEEEDDTSNPEEIGPLEIETPYLARRKSYAFENTGFMMKPESILQKGKMSCSNSTTDGTEDRDRFSMQNNQTTSFNGGANNRKGRAKEPKLDTIFASDDEDSSTEDGYTQCDVQKGTASRNGDIVNSGGESNTGCADVHDEAERTGHASVHTESDNTVCTGVRAESTHIDGTGVGTESERTGRAVVHTGSANTGRTDVRAESELTARTDVHTESERCDLDDVVLHIDDKEEAVTVTQSSTSHSKIRTRSQ